MILDERSAGFFALGTALATGVPAVVLCTSGSAAAEPPPRRRRGRRGGRAADRAHRRPPSGAPRHRRRARRSTSSSSTATRCAGSARSGPTRRTTTACSTSARSPAAPTPRRIGDPRPGPVHLNVPWREPLAPVPVRGSGDAPAIRSRSRGGAMRPLHAVTPAAPRADEAVLDRLAERIESAPRGLIVAGPAARPAARRADRRAGRRRGLSDPGRAHLPAAPGAARPLAARHRLRRHRAGTALSSSSPSWSSASATCPPASRCASGSPAIDDLEQIVIDPAGEWREPTRRAATLLRADPDGDRAGADGAAFPAAPGRRDGRRLALRSRPGWRPSRPFARRSTAGSAPSASSASRASGQSLRPCAAGRRLGLRRLEHAGARPRGLPAPRPRGRPVRLEPGRERDRWAGLHLGRPSGRQRQPHLGGARRPRPLPRHRRPGGRAACSRSCA